MRYQWNYTERKPHFTGILPHMRSLFIIEGIHNGKVDMKDDVVSKMIEELDNMGGHWVGLIRI